MFEPQRKSDWTSRQAAIDTCLAEYGLSSKIGWPSTQTPAADPAVRLCSALTRMGPVFQAFGRYLSTRFDLLSLDQCEQLALLPEPGNASQPAAVARVLELEHGDWRSAISEFCPQALEGKDLELGRG